MLPIDSLLPQIAALVRPGANLVIEAAPGAGKTTRVPPALLRESGEVVVLEPRRIAARMAARRVAEELGSRVGELVGYQVRFEDTTSKATRIKFATEGVLTRRLITDPELRSVSVVILDEFHERHLETDLALALLLRLQKTRRPDLSIVVMSATLDTAPVARFLGDCPVVRSEGRAFELRVEYTPYSPEPVEAQVAAAVKRLINEDPTGDILVFLPGAAEIRRAARELEPLARRSNLLLAPLYGDLSPAEQDRAVASGPQRRIVLATNIAESSITIEGVRAVVDSGLARVASDSPWTGLPSLDVKRISKASAHQRAGRAGRTGPGRAIRLYTAEDFHRRAEHDTPEILRRELSGLCLQLQGAGVAHPDDIEWLDVPPAEAISMAEDLLHRLEARGPDLPKMLRLPVHPRLARLIISGSSERACQAAALLSSGQRVNSLDDAPDERTQAVFRQLRTLVSTKGAGEDLDLALLRAFPDRVGKRGSGTAVLLSNGKSIEMKKTPGQFMVVIDPPWLAHPIQPEWLIDIFPDRLREVNSVEWNREGARVEAVSALLYDELVIEESRGGKPDEEAAAQLLAAKATEAGLAKFIDMEEFEELRARVAFAAEHSAVEPITDERIQQAMTALCRGHKSFSELGKALGSLGPMLEAEAGPALERIAPSRQRLGAGRTVKVRYEQGKAPWVASRLQDFFGMKETPKIANGKVPLTVHLLAPNQRPVQTTTDLAGFWTRLYPQLRRELGRRYPRHSWPEDPLQ